MPEIKEFDCPTCKSNERLYRSVEPDEKKAYLMSIGEPGKIDVQMDVCKKCGTVYCFKYEIGGEQKQ